MKLFFRKLGQGKPMIILHGLFGQSDNWQTPGKQFSEAGYEIYLADLRNHGHSPHSDEWNYKAMSADVLELVNDLHLKDFILMGHSLGGKVAMQFALDHPEKLSRLIVADIAPKYYAPHHDKIIEGLKSLDFNSIRTRKEAEEQLSKYIPDSGTRQFLLKNLYWKEENRLAWRFNLGGISKNIEVVGETFDSKGRTCPVPVLFLRGERSEYILDEDIPTIRSIFPHYKLVTIPGAGHWIHVDQPQDFYEKVSGFMR